MFPGPSLRNYTDGESYSLGFLNVSKMLYCDKEPSSVIDWKASSHPLEACSFINRSSSSIFSNFGFLTPALTKLEGVLKTSLLYSNTATLSFFLFC